MINGRIRHLHHQYRIVNPRANAKTTAQWLTHLAETQLPAQLSQMLGTVLADQQQVVILRQVDTSLTLRLAQGQADNHLVKRWSAKLAGAIVQQLARPSGDSQSLVRFADQAEFITCFIIDLLHDRAWNNWYYFPFDQWKEYDTAVILQEILHEYKAEIPAIITRLKSKDQLEPLIQKLDEPTMQYVWRQGIQGRHQLSSLDSWRPLFAAALTCVNALGWTLESGDNETHFQTYLATNPIPVDWQDRRALAITVAAIIRFLSNQRAQPEAGSLSQERAVDLTFFNRTVAQLDWLDTAWLRDDILQMNAQDVGENRKTWAAETAVSTTFISNTPQAEFAYLPVRPVLEPMPRQHQLCADILMSLTPDILAQLDRFQPDSPENAIRIFAALGQISTKQISLPLGTIDAGKPQPKATYDEAKTDPTLNDERLANEQAESSLQASFSPIVNKQPNNAGEETIGGQPQSTAPDLSVNWQDDSLVANTIQLLLQAWQSLMLTAVPKQTIKLLQQGQIRAALEMLPQPQQKEAEPIFRYVVRLGSNGQAILLRLIGEGKVGRVNSSDYGTTIETNCAGLFLLSRAVLDSRLLWIVKQLNFPGKDEQRQLPLWLLALGLCWAGDDSIIDDEIDPGVALFAGASPPLSVAELTSLWSNVTPRDCLRMQPELLRLLVGLRLMQGHELFIHQLSLTAEQSAVVLGTAENGGIWPIVQVITEDVNTTLASCLTAWTEATGMPLTSIATDLPLAMDGQDVTVLSPDDTSVAETFAENRERLSTTLAILENGRLGLPDLDLTIAMTANTLLRIWARWLPQFATASTPYLLQNFVQRSGRIQVSEDQLQVRMTSKPLDIVLNMTGYLSTLENVSWLDGRHVHFHL